MADGYNNSRAARIIEIMGDFNALQQHINAQASRQEANPSDAASQRLDGFRLIQQCAAEARRLLATPFNPGNLGFQPGQVPATEVMKAQLQRIVLDASTRRFRAHKIYLRIAACIRWVLGRREVLNRGGKPADLQAKDIRLRQEVAAITDQSVISDLRAADVRKGYWVNEDPSLDRILAWARTQT